MKKILALPLIFLIYQSFAQFDNSIYKKTALSNADAFKDKANFVGDSDFFDFSETYSKYVGMKEDDLNIMAIKSDPIGITETGTLSLNQNISSVFISQSPFLGTETLTRHSRYKQVPSAGKIETLNVNAQNQVIISQYYEGAGVNKWIELTNLSGSPINTASSQLQLALYSISGDAGNINFSSSSTPSQKVSLTITIPAYGSVLIGNTSNAQEVPYIATNSAAQYDNNVISFNGNDGIALLDANNNILDAFGQGLNTKDVSYVRKLSVTGGSPSFIASDWDVQTIGVVQEADDLTDPNRLGVHIAPVNVPCVAPLNAASNLVFGTVGYTNIQASFTPSADADEYLVVRSTSATLSSNPNNGTIYNLGDLIGNGAVIARSSATSFNATSLANGTTYYFYIYPLNSVACSGGPLYLSNSLNGNKSTNTPPVCLVPTQQPSNFNITLFNYNFIEGSFTTTNADEYLVVMSSNSTLSNNPINGTTYAVGASLGGGIVVKTGSGNTFSKTGLTASTNYHFFIYSLNSNCSNGPIYLSSNPLLGNQTTASSNSGALNFYYGNMHAHSSSSDGNKEDLSKGPAEDYAFAKTAMYMDFLGISEHNHTGAGMALSKWKPGLLAAKNSTTSTFAAMYGMEWGTISGGGHVIIYGIDSLIGWEPNQYNIFVEKGVYTGNSGLFKIINRHGLNALGYLAHPNTSDYNSIANTFDAVADQAIVGAAVESGPAFSLDVNYNNPASSMSFLSYYNKMLSKGYHLGPIIDHDNHYLTFGKTAKSRLVVLAPSLTENNLLGSMKQMRFYATQDYGAKITFKINNQPLGSIITDRSAPIITVNAITSSAVSSVKIWYGVPGSGATPTVITSGNAATLSYTDHALANLSTRYYYIDITASDGTRTITAPIWYTRNDQAALPITLTSFTAQAEGKTVHIKWSTSTEINNDYFTIERSQDGKNFSKIAEVKGFGNSNINRNYQVIDFLAFKGINYYRLRQTDFDGKSTVSEIKAVKSINGADKAFNIYPNPVENELVIALTSEARDLNLKIIGADGKIVIEGTGTVTQLNQLINRNLISLKPGIYSVKIANLNESYSNKLIKR